MSYIGNTPANQNFVAGADQFNGTGSQTVFTLSRNVNTVFDMFITVSNVPQDPFTAYSVAGNSLTFTSAPPSGTGNIDVVYRATNVQTFVPSPGVSAQFGLGSAASPSMTFIGNTTTGVFSPAANTLAFSTNGTEDARFDSAGNMGVGTTSPTNKLQVSSAGADVARFTNTLSNGGDWQFKIGGGGFEDRKLMITDKFSGADNVRLSIDSSGNVAVTGTVTGTNLFGQSQTWTNVTGSRATGTTYTNSTGRPIMVVVTPVASGSLIGTFNISGSAVGFVQFTPSGGGGGSPFFYIIPNGVTYSVTNNANFNINYWWELR